MPLTISQFFDRLRASAVLPPDNVEALWARIPKDKRAIEAERFASKLVELGNLTSFQASSLLKDEGNRLVLGEYVLLEEIGAGGMGQVFKARHRRLKRVAAIKLLPVATMETPQAIKRFQREAEAAAKLAHPNIVAVYDAGEQKGIHYLVMEYVERMDLANLVRRNGPLPVEDAVLYIAQAAHGLAHAHASGVIHRDIKPANLLLDSQGTVKILDLGLARFDDHLLTESVEDLTKTGTFMGSVDFMSPEQALDTRSADTRSDQYSLGCTLFYLLTGKPLYAGDTVMKRLVGHREQPVPSLSALRADVPAELVVVFERMVAKRPGERFQDLAGVRQSLARCEVAKVYDIVPGNLTKLTAESEVVGAREAAANLDNELAITPPRAAVPVLVSVSEPPITSSQANQYTQNDSGQTVETNLDWTSAFKTSASLLWRFAVDLEPSNRLIFARMATSCGIIVLIFVLLFGRNWETQTRPDLPAGKLIQNSIFMKMRYIPPGTFNMGSPNSEMGRKQNERLHHVLITKGFYIGQYEVTREEYEAVMGKTWKVDPIVGEKGLSSRFPVAPVSWENATEFCKKLSVKEGKTYRLPTEAEWEYACRAGTKSAYHFGDKLSSDLANYGTSGTTEVGAYAPNPFGLYDMHGNVSEWCSDWCEDDCIRHIDPEGPSSGKFRVDRGGSWGCRPADCRSANRPSGDTHEWDLVSTRVGIGFRVVRTYP